MLYSTSAGPSDCAPQRPAVPPAQRDALPRAPHRIDASLASQAACALRRHIPMPSYIIAWCDPPYCTQSS
eukprot:5561261-Pleurochrysis_carterae.AAC.5